MAEIKRTARSHYKVINGELVPKKNFNTEAEALQMARFLNSRPNTIHKTVAYKCSKCQYWHIGTNGKLLTQEDREEAEKKLNNKIY